MECGPQYISTPPLPPQSHTVSIFCTLGRGGGGRRSERRYSRQVSSFVHTVKFHFVTIKHVVMFFKLQFSYQQLVFIFKIVKTLVTISQSYPTIWKSCVWILLIYNQLMLPSPLPFHLEIVPKKITRGLWFYEIFWLVCLCNMHK